MRAFISYSINDKDQFILTLLASKLRNDGFQIASGNNYLQNILDVNTASQINQSHLFIGIITAHSSEQQRVLREWDYAQRGSIPSLLLIEDSVSVASNFTGNYIRFNRQNPQIAINNIKTRKEQANNVLNANNEAAAWVLGGAALLALIALFSKSK
jgi:hypothetical protein